MSIKSISKLLMIVILSGLVFSCDVYSWEVKAAGDYCIDRGGIHHLNIFIQSVFVQCSNGEGINLLTVK